MTNTSGFQEIFRAMENVLNSNEVRRARALPIKIAWIVGGAVLRRVGGGALRALVVY